MGKIFFEVFQKEIITYFLKAIPQAEVPKQIFTVGPVKISRLIGNTLVNVAEY